MIAIEEKIEVPSTPSEVWAVLSDPREVVSCIGGSQLDQLYDDGRFDAKLSVRFGGIRVVFAVSGLLELQEDDRVGRISARGSDRQGATRVSGGASFVVSEGRDGLTLVTMSGEVDIKGRLASVINAGAGVVIDRMTREFSAQLRLKCAGAQVDPDAPGIGVTVERGTPSSLAQPGCRSWPSRLLVRLRALIGRRASKSTTARTGRVNL